MTMEELSLHDILAVLRRRRKYALAVAGIVFLAVSIVAVRWSSYRSMATVRIEQSDVSEALAAPQGGSSVDMTLVDQRIGQIEQTVTAADSLGAIIDKYNLYPSARRTSSLPALAAKMSKKIKLDFIESTLSNPAAAQKASAEQLSAIAFTLSFEYSNPELAQQVTSELVRRFQQEDMQLRRHQAEETSAFLATQIAKLEETMAGQEKKIADFRAQHGESGPAALTFDEQAASSTYLALQSIDSEISANEGTEGKLRVQLATIDPYSRVTADGQVLTTPAVQLKALKSQYAALSSQYGPGYPDVIKARHEIDALEAEQDATGADGQSEDTAGLQAMIQDVQTNLAAAKATSGPDNPNVAALQHQLKKLQARLADAHRGTTGATHGDADNPAYLQIEAQLRALEEQQKSLSAQRSTLFARQEKYQQAIAQNPVVEQQMSSLSRDYDNEQVRYRELKEKKMAADMSEELETRPNDQRLIVNVPPNLPTKTHPSKLMIMAGGAMLSVIAGLVAVVVAEAASQNMYGAHQLAQLAGAPPLVTIPYIFNEAEMDRRRRVRPYVIGAVGAAIALAAILFPFVVMPYEALWSTLAQKLDF